jgi:hypothetical protein
MNLFFLFGSKKLAPLWEYHTHGVIWRLLPAEGEFIVGEDRDHEKRTVSFFCLDEQTGKTHWSNVQFTEPWWISIETVHQNVVFLHEFVRPDFPDHQKIIAVDLSSGKTLWRNEDYKFMFAHENCVYAMKEMFESIAVYELELRSGEILRDLKDQPDYVKVLRETAASQQSATAEYPNPLLPGQSEYRQVFAKHIEMNKLLGEIEFIDADPYIVFGHYENTSTNPLEQVLDQHLTIIEQESGSTVFSDVISRKAKMPVPDLFFVRNNILFYVKNQNRLRAVKLPFRN